MTLRTRLHLEEEIPEEALSGDLDPPYFRPSPDSPEGKYLRETREKLGGAIPSRTVDTRSKLELPPPQVFDQVFQGSGKVEASTTTAFTRMLRDLARAENFGPRVVPIVPDEARTFGMDSLFRELKIYASKGQLYEPVDASMLLAYVEGKDGQILEEGITEAGSMASWIAAGTATAPGRAHGSVLHLLFDVWISTTGDFIWAASDARARGFLIGATAGRTTLAGEGLQHQDGHSLVLASTIPAVQAYDPAFAYETGVVVRDGIRRMYGNDEDIFYYLTATTRTTSSHPSPTGSIRASWTDSTNGPTLQKERRTKWRFCSPGPPTWLRERLRPSWQNATTWGPNCGRRHHSSFSARTPWKQTGGTGSTPEANLGLLSSPTNSEWLAGPLSR